MVPARGQPEVLPGDVCAGTSRPGCTWRCHRRGRRPITPITVTRTTAASTPPMNHSWLAVTWRAAMARRPTASSTTQPMAGPSGRHDAVDGAFEDGEREPARLPGDAAERRPSRPGWSTGPCGSGGPATGLLTGAAPRRHLRQLRRPSGPAPGTGGSFRERPRARRRSPRSCERRRRCRPRTSRGRGRCRGVRPCPVRGAGRPWRPPRRRALGRTAYPMCPPTTRASQ